MNVINALNWRYSVKSFSEQKLQQWQLRELLEATRLSPSSYGLQPYKVIVIESKSVRQRLLPFAYGQEQVIKSSHLLVFAARTDIGSHLVSDYIQEASKNNDTSSESLTSFAAMAEKALETMNTKEGLHWAQQEAFIALGNMLTSAAMMKIDTCPIGGFDAQEFDAILNLTANNLASTVICPIGIRDPNDKYSQRRKVRFDHQHLVMEI